MIDLLTRLALVGAAATFSKSAVIFEDAYMNSPGNCVGRQSSQTELHCVAHGGPNGGHIRFEILGDDKLERVSGHVLPVEQDVSPGMKLDFTITYKGKLPSSAAEDIIVTTTFTENVQGATQEVSTAKLTSVKIELTAVASAPRNSDNHRHTYGIFVPNPTTQEFRLQSNGTFRIRKFGHEAERSVYGLIWIDGELQ